MTHSSTGLPAVLPVIEVSCASWREFAERYARDLASGGLYIRDALAQPLLSSLEVRLSLPEAIEIELRARVVQVVAGASPGLALELQDLDLERKRQIGQLLEFVRTHGADDDPRTSFTRTLLELSTSLPPNELAQRLSQLPGAPPVRKESRPLIPNAEPASPTRSSSSSTTTTNARQITSRAAAALRARQISQSVSLPPRSPSTQLFAPPAQTSQSSTTIPVQREPPASMPAAVSGAVSSQNTKLPSPAGPTDERLLRLVLSSVAHKHYDAAVRITQEMLAQNPGDPQALRWQATCQARLASARNDHGGACNYYEQVLRSDPDNREAREFVRTYERDKKLNSLPFGRYFTTKK